MNEDVALAQKKWVHELRTGGHVQADGDLVTPTHAMCVVGVGGYVLAAGDFDELETWGLYQISEDYGLTEKQTRYLYNMNDGVEMCFDSKHVRWTYVSRDFNFCARWLEIVFALKEREV